MQATASRGVNDNVASVLMRAEVIQHMDPRSLARCLTTCTALRAPHEKRAKPTPVHQRALDVAARWAASRAGTADDEVATEYATALAAIARRQLSKNSSGGDGVAKPLRKKQHC